MKKKILEEGKRSKSNLNDNQNIPSDLQNLQCHHQLHPHYLDLNILAPDPSATRTKIQSFSTKNAQILSRSQKMFPKK